MSTFLCQMYQSCSLIQDWRRKKRKKKKKNTMKGLISKDRPIRIGCSRAPARPTPMPRTTAASCFPSWWPLESSFQPSSASAGCENKYHPEQGGGCGKETEHVGFGFCTFTVISKQTKPHTKRRKKEAEWVESGPYPPQVPALLQSLCPLCGWPQPSLSSPGYFSEADPPRSRILICAPSGKDSEPRADMVPFFRLDINSREMSSYYLRRPALGVGYVLKLCPDKFSGVLGLKVCVLLCMWEGV